MTHRVIAWCAGLVALGHLAAATALAAEKRALVVGMDAYAHLPRLSKGVRDAETMAAALGKAGFAVTVSRDAGRAALLAASRDFARTLDSVDRPIVLLYFATHAVEIDGDNVIYPVDAARPDSAAQGRLESVALADLVAMVRERSAGPVVIVVDACRDNPFARATRGLSKVASMAGIFALYSAGAGRCPHETYTAQTDDRPSPFAEALARHLVNADLDLVGVARAVQAEIVAASKAAGNEQRPAFYDDLGGEALHLAR